MTFYLLDDPAKPGTYARFCHVGTWSKGALCDICGVTTEKLVEPLQVEWDEGTEQIGSFSWCGYHCIVSDEVRAFLEHVKADCTFGFVEVMPPTKKTKKPRVPFPYTGPMLHWLIPTRRVPLNEVRSGVNLLSECSGCGHKQYDFKREGLVIDASFSGSALLFQIEQFGRSRATFITEPLLAGFVSKGFTNLRPHLAGYIE